MKRPVRLRAGAVAAAGTAGNSGDRNKAMINRIAVVSAVSPVFPPSATPAEFPAYVVTVLVPKIAPAVVPIASAMRACLQRGIFPSESISSALVETPVNVLLCQTDQRKET